MASWNLFLQFEKVFEDPAAVRMLIIKQFWVKLHTEKWSLLVLHPLNWTGQAGSGCLESRGKGFDFIEVGMPDGYVSRHSFENSLSVRLNFRKSPLTLCPGIAVPWLQASHQRDGRTESQSHLLMATTEPQNGPI